MLDYSSPRELLDLLLQGNEPELADIEKLADEFRNEGLHHDFKDGQATAANRRRETISDLRQDLSAFANSSTLR